MAMSSCVFSYKVRVSSPWNLPRVTSIASSRTVASALMSNNIAMLGQQVVGKEASCRSADSNFLGSPRTIDRPNLGEKVLQRKNSVVYAAWLTNSQIASSAFTLGTIAVLPFYTSMIVAPQAEFTKKLVSSNVLYIVFGVMYAYLLYLSWTPDTIQWMFASKYWLPELWSISKMFSSPMTLASAWIHLLIVDLFAARQIYEDGLRDKVETRHSVSMCLLFCPIGILAHFITKALTKTR